MSDWRLIELTGIDPFEYRYQTWKELVLVGQIDHISEYTGRDSNKVGATITMISGKRIHVTEKVAVIKAKIQEATERIRGDDE